MSGTLGRLAPPRVTKTKVIGLFIRSTLTRPT
jgi:hypothetical protein